MCSWPLCILCHVVFSTYLSSDSLSLVFVLCTAPTHQFSLGSIARRDTMLDVLNNDSVTTWLNYLVLKTNKNEKENPQNHEGPAISLKNLSFALLPWKPCRFHVTPSWGMVHFCCAQLPFSLFFLATTRIPSPTGWSDCWAGSLLLRAQRRETETTASSPTAANTWQTLWKFLVLC